MYKINLSKRSLSGIALKILFLVCAGVMMSGCHSAKSLQKDLRATKISLGYELYSDQYAGDKKAVVVFKNIGPVNMDFQTTVKKKKAVVVPLLAYNHASTNFRVILGEFSLDVPYSNFVTEAIFAESNYSGAFNITSEIPEESDIPVYLMEINFKSVTTQGTMRRSDNSFLWFGEDGEFGSAYLSDNSCNIKDIKTTIWAELKIYSGASCVHTKFIEINKNYPLGSKGKYIDNIAEFSMQLLGNSLSEATRDLVFEVVNDVNLFLNAN